MLALVITIALAHQVPNPPPIEPRLEETAPPDVEAEPPPIEEPDDDEQNEVQDEELEEDEPDVVTPPPDTRAPIAEPLWFSLLGCSALGCPAAAGSGVGAAVLVTLLSVSATGGVGGFCLGALGIVGGLVIGVPSVIALGPCTSGGALLGAIIGAFAGDRELAPLLIAAIPGIALGLLAAGGAVWGLAVLAGTSGDFILPVAILIVSTAAGLAAGPLTVVGVGVADAAAARKVDVVERAMRF